MTLKRQDCILDSIPKPSFGVFRRQQIQPAFQTRDDECVVTVAGQIVRPMACSLHETSQAPYLASHAHLIASLFVP